MSESINFDGMDLEIYYDSEGIIESVTNQGNENFLEYLDVFYMEKLGAFFDDHMKEQKHEAETERQLSNKADVDYERHVFAKHGYEA